MVNTDLLRGALRAKNITNEQAASAIGVNPATFYRRINQQGKKFTVAEVGKLAELLELSADEVQEIFFEK